MKILSIQALRGSNYWSHSVPKLIQLRVEFSPDDLMDSTLIDKYMQKLANTIERSSGTAELELATLLAKAAIVLQEKAGCAVSFLLCKETKFPFIYNIVFEYEIEKVGKQAAKSAVKLWQALLNDEEVNIESEINTISKIFLAATPSEFIQGVILSAKKSGVPVIALSDEGNWQLGYGKNGIELSEETSSESLQQLYSSTHLGRIPIIAVTGSNGKTTTTRLIAHIIKSNQQKVGFTTSDGIYINGNMIDEGDTTGPISAEVVLRNKEVEVAVLETARGGIVRAGLAFDACNIAVVTNVQDDHLGISDIETMDDLAKVKSVIVHAVNANGYAVLNADNEYTIAMGKNANCNVALFSMNANNPEIVAAIQNGNTVAFIENNTIVVQNTEVKLSIAHLQNVPITFDGKLGFMVQNAMAATLATYVFGIDSETIAAGLSSFFPSAEQTPGRMNIFEMEHCRVMVDFAHNPDGFSGIRDFMATINSPYKIGIIVGTGDRKEADVREIGRLSAAMFDHILIHQVKFLRGKTAEELVNLLVEGILSQNPHATWQRVPDDQEPLEYAMSIVPNDGFITALSDVLNNPTELISTYKNRAAQS